jgi:hypothetical protein
MTVTWHHGFALPDGTPYPLRHVLPDHFADLPYFDHRTVGLAADQARTAQAVHELAHAVLWMAAGIHVVDAAIGTEEGIATGGPVPPHAGLGCAVGLAAGERAEDRWLRETGLWTEERAAVAEVGAHRDRGVILAADVQPRVTFGGGDGYDYAHLHALADQALSLHWHRILTVAPYLVRATRLTGDEIAAHAGLPNPPLHNLT